MATSVNSVPLPAVPEVYGIRLPPVESRITAPNFTLIPRSAIPKSDVDSSAEPGIDNLGQGEGQGQGQGQGGQAEEEEEEEEDDDDDEEMEDVTAGLGGVGTASGSHRNHHSEKRKAEADENYD